MRELKACEDMTRAALSWKKGCRGMLRNCNGRAIRCVRTIARPIEAKCYEIGAFCALMICVNRFYLMAMPLIACFLDKRKSRLRKR